MKSTESTKALLKRVKERFFEEIDKKTGWGKNEVKAVYNEVLTEVVSDELFKLMPTDEQIKEIEDKDDRYSDSEKAWLAQGIAGGKE